MREIRIRSALSALGCSWALIRTLLIGLVILIVLWVTSGIMCDRMRENEFYSLIGKNLATESLYKKYKDDIVFQKVGPEWKSEFATYFQNSRLIGKINIEEVTESHAASAGIYVLELHWSGFTLDMSLTMALIFVDEHGFVTDVILVRNV